MFQRSSRACVLTGLGLSTGIFAPMVAQADLIDDSHLKVDMRNFYLHRDYTSGDASESRIGSWSQGFDLQFISGYTDTPVQVGLDVDAQYALRLDSRGDDGSLPINSSTDKASDNYSRAGATLKLRYSKTELKIGDLRPELPVAWHDPSRQLDTIYQGAVIESKEIDGLTLNGGRFWSVVTRDSSNHEKLYQYGYPEDHNSDGLDFVGATWDVIKNLQASYFYGVLNNIYKQQYVGLAHTAVLGAGFDLRTDARYFDNKQDGDALNGDIDNRAFTGGFTLSESGHKISLTYQRMYGDSMFPTLNGYIPQLYLMNWVNQPFIRPQERSWGVGYAYDFAAMGIPGLTFSSRFIKGTHIKQTAASDGSEHEQDLALKYVVQSGALKGLGLEWKNYRLQQHNFGSDFVENRLIVTYTWMVW